MKINKYRLLGDWPLFASLAIFVPIKQNTILSSSSVQRINNIIRRKHIFHILILQSLSSKLQA